MKFETIMAAAVNSMVRGKREPHCFSAHVIGKGYVNDGTDPATRADFLRQLERTAKQEVECMNYAAGYAEPGYTDPPKGILFANWNVFPKGLDDILERAGYAIEWSDEWSTCGDCGKAVRTSPDGYSWTPHYSEKLIEDGEFICLDCAPVDEDEDAAREAENADSNARLAMFHENVLRARHDANEMEVERQETEYYAKQRARLV